MNKFIFAAIFGVVGFGGGLITTPVLQDSEELGSVVLTPGEELPSRCLVNRVYGVYVVYTNDIYGEEAKQFRSEGCSTYDRVGYDYRWLSSRMDEPHVHRYVGAPEEGSETPLLPRR